MHFDKVFNNVINKEEYSERYSSLPSDGIIATIDEDLFNEIRDYCEENNIQYIMNYNSYSGIYLIKIIE